MTETIASEKAALPRLTLVTGNAGKLREVQACLAGHVDLESVALDLPELQSDTVAAVSRAKAQAAYALLRRPVLVEDTGLCLDALNGLPGPYIKWFLQRMGPTGLARLPSGFDTRSAQAVCVFTYCTGDEGDADGKVTQFVGCCEGSIVEIPRGKEGFGWDSIFQPNEGNGSTFAEMSMDEKNKISHRSKALILLKKHFCE
ncbi:Inosine triphosphate pyrophosphatase family protein isoform 1 [Trypanosoma theileri]|uniref:Inosine triphosphate pyrophosphatase n=1 Tax=Trypanosoma theileri TaxID=67003 RepID=A0A1X0P0N6_9TRYP|nr:Inosine triphosphate pyrophosphatase family protein isoform 1 [Trypanosoma theileri]ORC90401.1 Inosine triphosphate pyrophosphatase family protein isoform 1 [Trypanosoma theileri]